MILNILKNSAKMHLPSKINYLRNHNNEIKLEKISNNDEKKSSENKIKILEEEITNFQKK